MEACAGVERPVDEDVDYGGRSPGAVGVAGELARRFGTDGAEGQWQRCLDLATDRHGAIGADVQMTFCVRQRPPVDAE